MNACLSFYAHTFKGRRDYNQDAFETLKIKEGVFERDSEINLADPK